MIKDIIDKNAEVKPNSKKMEALKEYFAGCFTKEGTFDIERFKEMMKDEVDISNEGYSLDFLGKDYANLIASIDINKKGRLAVCRASLSLLKEELLLISIGSYTYSKETRVSLYP